MKLFGNTIYSGILNLTYATTHETKSASGGVDKFYIRIAN